MQLRPPFRRLALTILVAMTGTALVAACGGSSVTTTPTPTPLTQAQLQARYSAAAALYNRAESQVSVAENAACDAASPTVALPACQAALGQQRDLTIAYDSALRSTAFTGSAATDAAHLLSDDAAIEALLEQAATAPSLTVIATLQSQIIPLLATAAATAAALRSDIGLPAPA